MQAELFLVEIEVPTWKVARLLGWSPKKARRALCRSGHAHRIPGASGWYVRRSDLIEMDPQLERRLREMEESGAMRMPGRARPGNSSAAKRQTTNGDNGLPV